MQKAEIQAGFATLRTARAELNKIIAKFNADEEAVLARLLNEAASQHMSAEQIAALSGRTPTKIRYAMRTHGLNPKDGKRLLAHKAAENLANNAALLGVEPSEMDLMSPLAYLPAGSLLRELAEPTNTAESLLGTGESSRQQMIYKLADAGVGNEAAEQWIDEVVAESVTANTDGASVIKGLVQA